MTSVRRKSHDTYRMTVQGSGGKAMGRQGCGLWNRFRSQRVWGGSEEKDRPVADLVSWLLQLLRKYLKHFICTKYHSFRKQAKMNERLDSVVFLVTELLIYHQGKKPSLGQHPI